MRYGILGNGDIYVPCKEQVEQLVMLNAILAHKPVGVHYHWDEHVSSELVHFVEVKQYNKELVEGILHLTCWVGFEVLSVIVFYPRHT